MKNKKILNFLKNRWESQDNNTNLKEKALVLSLQKFIIDEENENSCDECGWIEGSDNKDYCNCSSNNTLN